MSLPNQFWMERFNVGDKGESTLVTLSYDLIGEGLWLSIGTRLCKSILGEGRGEDVDWWGMVSIVGWFMVLVGLFNIMFLQVCIFRILVKLSYCLLMVGA